jgi:hypothetical protein
MTDQEEIKKSISEVYSCIDLMGILRSENPTERTQQSLKAICHTLTLISNQLAALQESKPKVL